MSQELVLISRDELEQMLTDIIRKEIKNISITQMIYPTVCPDKELRKNIPT